MRDYVLFLIQQFIHALARALGLVRSGDYHHARLQIEELYRVYLGIPPENARAIGLPALLAMIGADPSRFCERAYLLCGILRADAQLQQAQGDTAAAQELIGRARLAAEAGIARSDQHWRAQFVECLALIEEEAAAMQSPGDAG